MNWTFGRKLALGFMVAVLTVAVIGFSGHRATGELIETNHWVAHTQEVKRTLVASLAALIDSETGQRGFLLTGDEQFLAPYQSARDRTEKELAHAQQLTVDNPQQQRRLATLAPIVDQRLAIMARGIELRRSQGLDGVLKSAILNEGR